MMDEDCPGPGKEVQELLKDVPDEARPQVSDLLATFRASMWLAFSWWKGEARVSMSDRRTEEIAEEREEAFNRAREKLRDGLRAILGRPLAE
jgi:hypothetical protein